MAAFEIAATIGLAMWVGGLSLFSGVISPAAFRSFGKPEAGRIIGTFFPAVDRWASVWGFVTLGALFFQFFGRTLEVRSLVLGVPVLVMWGLTLYCATILHPQIRELKVKMGLEQFKETAHLETIRFAFGRLHKRSVQLHFVILTLGLFCLGLVPRVLE